MDFSNAAFSPLVEHGRHEHEAGRDARLEGAEEEAGGGEAGKVVGGRHAQQHDAPQGDEDAAGAGNVEVLEEEADGELKGQVPEVEDGRQPRVLGPHEVRVVLHAPERGVRHARLVEELDW